MKRYLVVFASHPTPPIDSTIVDVTAECPLSAILTAKREALIAHDWSFVRVVRWPRGCVDVDTAAEKIAAAR